MVGKNVQEEGWNKYAGNVSKGEPKKSFFAKIMKKIYKTKVVQNCPLYKFYFINIFQKSIFHAKSQM